MGAYGDTMHLRGRMGLVSHVECMAIYDRICIHALGTGSGLLSIAPSSRSSCSRSGVHVRSRPHP
jgi:hypothetical protein